MYLTLMIRVFQESDFPAKDPQEIHEVLTHALSDLSKNNKVDISVIRYRLLIEHSFFQNNLLFCLILTCSIFLQINPARSKRVIPL